MNRKSIVLNATGEEYADVHTKREVFYNIDRKAISVHEHGFERADFTYGAAMQRTHAWYGNEEEALKDRRFAKHYSSIFPAEIKVNQDSGKTTLVFFAGGDAYTAPVAIINDQEHYLHRDHLGSILSISDGSGKVIEERHFSAWGEVEAFTINGESADFSDSLLTRGFTGHEHFEGIELIHMNGRMYDAKIRRFLSPDNHIQDPYNTMSYDRFGYVWQNPLMNNDPSGESFWSSVGDWIKRNSKIITAVATIAVAVVVTVATAGMASPLLAAAIVGASAGFTAGAVGTWTQGGSFLDGIGNGLVQGAIGAVSGFVGGAAGQWAAKGLGNLVVNGFNVSSPVVKGIIGGAIGGAAGGYAGGFTAGFLMTGKLSSAHKAGLSGMKQGAGLGALTGGVTAYKAAKAQGINPWSGKKFNDPINNGFNGNTEEITLQPGERLDRYGNESGRYTSPEGTPYNQRSMPPFSDKSNYNIYEVLKPIEGVRSGQINPYYLQEGGGTQYLLPQKIKWYLELGYIRKY